MSTGADPGFLAFDPTRAAVAGAILAEGTGVNGAGVGADTGGAGGGLITATGTYYSKPTQIKAATDASEVLTVLGIMAATLTVEISNHSEQEDRLGTSTWITYTKGALASIPAITGSTSIGLEMERVGYARVRTKLVVASLTAPVLVTSRRVVKGRA